MNSESAYEFRMRLDAACSDLFDKLLIALHPEVVCDVGAFNGDDSRRFAMLLPSSTVVAFEASPRNVRSFWEQPDVPQQPPNLRLANVAVADKTGMVEFNELSGDGVASDWRTAAGSILDRVRHEDFARVRVPSITLDDYLAANSLSDCSLALWIDVEGAADKVIRGARKALRRAKLIRVEVEWWAEWDGQFLAPELRGILESYGFVCVADSFVPGTTSQSDLLFVSANLLSDIT